MTELFRQLFLNPQMLAGIGLVSVPIIIYLINRQRYQRVRWAAMEFLLRALKRHQRKIQLQNLLLLLIRIAVIALLALALARPVWRQGRMAVTPEKNQNWIIAVDTSYSMSFEEGDLSLLEQAKENVSRLVEVILEPGDRVALMTLEARPAVVLPPVSLNDEGRAKLLDELADLELSTSSVDLGACFSTLDELAGEFVTPLGEPEPKRILLFSDFQRRDWLGDDGAPSPGVGQYIQKIQDEGGEFAFAQLSSRLARPNLAIRDLEASPALIARDVWVELRATIENLGDEDLANIDLTLQVDSDPDDATFEPQLGDVVRVPAGGSLTRVLPYKFTTPGYHTVVAELRSDGLRLDNRRFLTLRVADRVRVLLVDGDPSYSPVDRETFHLEVALAPEGYSPESPLGRFTPFEPDAVTSDQLGTRELSDYAVVVLANVAEVSLEEVESLKRYVRSGGALLVFLGRNVQPEFYNRHFGDDGLLPGVIESVRGDPRYPVHVEVADPKHPIARYFEEHAESTHLQRPVIAFGKYFHVSGVDSSRPEVRLPFRFSDTLGSPAVFDNAYGDGRVLWMTSTADQDWNEFSSWPDYVVFLYESITYLVQFGMSSSNLLAGEPFRRAYPGAEYASEVVLRTPESISSDLRRSRNVRKAMRSLPDGEGFEIVHEDTGAPGLYRLDLIRSGIANANGVEYFAVNVDTRESALRSMLDEDFQTHFENLRYQGFDASERIRRLEGEQQLLRGREYWKWLAYAVLILLAAETVLAYLFGRKVA